jgi:hypothetical protein
MGADPGTEGAFLGIALHPSAGLFLHVCFIFCKSNITVPEFIGAVFAIKQAQNARFHSLKASENRVYKLGHSTIRDIKFYVLHFDYQCLHKKDCVTR